MRIKLALTEVDSGETEEVIVGLPVFRIWEAANGKPLMPQIDAGFVGVLSEVAHLAWQRKHGKKVTIDEFEDRFELELDNAAPEVAAQSGPSEPATDPLTG